MTHLLYASAETVVLALVLAASAFYVVKRFLPTPLFQLRMKLALRLGRGRNPGWQRRLSTRIAPPLPVARGGCGSGGCSRCNNCG